jgi:hypothetical protein
MCKFLVNRVEEGVEFFGCVYRNITYKYFKGLLPLPSGRVSAFLMVLDLLLGYVLSPLH